MTTDSNRGEQLQLAGLLYRVLTIDDAERCAARWPACDSRETRASRDGRRKGPYLGVYLRCNRLQGHAGRCRHYGRDAVVLAEWGVAGIDR